jgi:4-hydroxy-tetrahydrodipicolinate synthase
VAHRSHPPLTVDEEVDEEGLRRVIDYVVEGGVDGLWMFGTRGEGPNLGSETHRRALEITMDEVNGRVSVVTGCGAPGTQHTIDNIRVAEACGVDLVHVTEPYYYKMKDTEMLAHYEAVVEAARLPVVIYFHDGKYANIKPGVCPEVVKKLASNPKVVGIKASTGDQRVLQSLVWGTQDVTDNFGVMVTDGLMFVAGMLVGCSGATPPEAAFAPKLFVDMQIAVKEGDLARAFELQKTVVPLTDAITGFGAPSSKVALAALGLCEEYVSMPLQPMPEPHRQRLIDLMKSGEYR